MPPHMRSRLGSRYGILPLHMPIVSGTPVTYFPFRRQLTRANGCISWIPASASAILWGRRREGRIQIQAKLKSPKRPLSIYTVEMDIPYVPFSSLVLSSSSLNISLIIPYRAMSSFTSLLVVTGLALQTVFGLPGPSKVVQEREAELLKRSVDSFIATESPIALTDLLCNIGSAGSCASGASSGIVIASPDRTNPDCDSLPPV